MAQTRVKQLAHQGQHSASVSWEFVRLLFRQYKDDGCREIAAALTYTTLFAIVPVMTVAFAILSAMPALKGQGKEIQAWMFDYFVPAAGDKIQEHLSTFAEQTSNLTAIGAVFLVVTSVLLLRTIEMTMNRIWKVRTPRKGMTSLLMYWAVLTLGPLLLGAGLGISSYVTSVSLVTDTMGYLGGKAFWLALLPVFFTTAMLSLLYIVVPNCHVPFRQGLAGGAVAAVFFELAKGAFALFVGMAPSYQVVYGAFAAVPIFLLWIFISWSIVLFGAELVRALVIFQERRQEVPPLQSLLRLLELLWKRQQEGRALKTNEVRKALLSIRASRWEEFRNLLMDMGLMRRAEDGSFFLSRDLRAMTLGDLVTELPWPAQTQLRLSDHHKRGWEDQLDDRLDQARQGLMAPLDIDLETLFQLSKTDSQQPKSGADND
jgi:membrane protein